MFSNIDFDKVTDSYSVIPAGTYTAIVESAGKYMWTDGGKIDCSGKTTPGTADEHLEIKFQIIDDTNLKGRVHFENMRLWSDNEQQANIARARFKQLCQALDVDPSSGKLDVLLNKPVKITIKHSKTATKSDGTPYTNITKITKADGIASDPDVPF